MKKKVVTVIKTKIIIKVADILQDVLSAMSDEDILEKYDLSWNQLQKVYTKLYYGGYVSKSLLELRYCMRQGKRADHIPFVEIEENNRVYECMVCGYVSHIHFSSCPRCKQINLRRLNRSSVSNYYSTSYGY